MTKKKLFAILSAMACAASCMMGTAVFAEDAESGYLFAVIGVDNEEAPERYIVMDVGGEGFPRYISAAELAPFMPVDAEAPKYGDILDVRTGYCEEPLAATSAIYFDGVGTNSEISCLYSVFDTTETEVFTVDGLALGTNFPVLVSQDGKKSIYANDFLRSYVQPGSVDMRDLKKGDEVTMYVMNGNPVVPATQDDLYTRDEFVVIGVDDPANPQNYVIIASGNPYSSYFLSAQEVEPYLAAGGTPLSYGDIFTVAGGYWCTCFGGTNDFGFEKAETIRIEGSVFDKAETAEFTAISKPNEDTYVWLEGAEKNYEYPVDFVLDIGLSLGNVDFTQPDGIDWAKPDLGDKVTMYVYNGVPMFPKALARIGDADGDYEINAGDAAEILLAAAESGTGAEVDATSGFDVNADGVVNAADASAVLVYATAQGADAPMDWAEILQ